MPWLFATVTASTPARRRTPKAAAGARKVNSFGWAVPRSVTAVSRLTTARSARRRMPKADPTRPRKAPAAVPSKCTSPAKASKTEPLPDDPAVVAGAVAFDRLGVPAAAGAVPDADERAAGDGRSAAAFRPPPLPHAASASTAASAAREPRRRRTVTAAELTRALFPCSGHCVKAEGNEHADYRRTASAASRSALNGTHELSGRTDGRVACGGRFRGGQRPVGCP